MSSPTLLLTCDTVPPLSNSDHLGLLLRTQWRQYRQPTNHPAQMIWLYKHADWRKARRLIQDTDWNSLITDDINVSWHNWQKHFLEIMKRWIPKRSLPGHYNLPWLSKSLIQMMKRKNMLFSRAKRSKKVSDFEKYKRIWNRVVAKSKFFNSIDPSNPKKFWKVVKYFTKNHSSIPTLSHDGTAAHLDDNKAEMLSDFFSTCFNTELSPL